MYTELSVINACLASMGEAPVLDITVSHPYIPQAVAILARHNKMVQSKRWWFNATKVLITPIAPSYTVAADLPVGVLSVIGINNEALSLSADGSVYDLAAGEVLTSPTTVIVLREIAFTLLPVSANVYIAACTIMEFQSSFDADSTKMQLIAQQKREALTDLTAEHIRLSKANLLSRPSTAGAMRRIRGDRPSY